MGRLKHMMEQGYDSDNILTICSDCILESGIKDFIIKNDDHHIIICSFCNKKRTSKTFMACKIHTVVGYILDCIKSEWTDPANVLPYESAEGGYQGQVLDTSDLLNNLGVEVADESILDQIVDSIEQSHWVKTSYFSLSPDETLIYGWKSFCTFVISQSRFFFLNAKNDSYDKNQHDEMNPIQILDSVASIITNLGMLKIILPDQGLRRVRIVDDYNEATTAKHLGSPPPDRCNMANRMSPAGISMFYGAFDLATAVKETYEPEPTIIKKAVVGNFYPCRSLNVIDLSKPFKSTSLFDEDEKYRFEKSFLRDFIRDFTKSIERADRAHIDYVPTQIVTEYFRHVLTKTSPSLIDGVIYPSSKNINHNAIVIFADNDQCIERTEEVRTNSILALHSYETVDLKPFNIL
jgi:hypothetical protein